MNVLIRLSTCDNKLWESHIIFWQHLVIIIQGLSPHEVTVRYVNMYISNPCLTVFQMDYLLVDAQLAIITGRKWVYNNSTFSYVNEYLPPWLLPYNNWSFVSISWHNFANSSIISTLANNKLWFHQQPCLWTCSRPKCSTLLPDLNGYHSQVDFIM